MSEHAPAPHAEPAAPQAPVSPQAAVGYFRDEAAFLAACRAGRAAGYGVDAVTPYPVHGLDPILGLERSWIGRPVLTVILLGCAAVMHALILNGTEVWPVQVSGKPYAAWPAFVVCTLEAGLLFGAIVNLLLCFHTARLLPLPATRVIDARLTDDTFAVVLPVTAGSAATSAAALTAFLTAQHAERVEIVDLAPGAAVRAEPAHA